MLERETDRQAEGDGCVSVQGEDEHSRGSGRVQICFLCARHAGVCCALSYLRWYEGFLGDCVGRQ